MRTRDVLGGRDHTLLGVRDIASELNTLSRGERRAVPTDPLVRTGIVS